MMIDVQKIYEQTRSYTVQLRDKKYRPDSRTVLEDQIETIRKQHLSQVVPDTYDLLHSLDWALSHPELVQSDLLATYIAELIRLMENAGAGLDFREAIDKVINFYQATGQSTVDLHLAKVEYLRLTDTESFEKEKSLETAADVAQSSEETIRVLLKFIQYYIDSSQYERAIKKCNEAINFVKNKTDIDKYSAKVFDLLGITYFYLFDYKTAKINLEKACELGTIFEDEHTLGESLHYLGRIAMDEGDFFQAMLNLIESSQHQTENVADIAWYHLRMGNLLTKSNLIKEACDHLAEAQELFTHIHYNGSALVQVELAWADVYKAQVDFQSAEDHIHKAIRFAKDTKFFRGELWCLVNLFWLQLVHLHRIDKAIYTFLLAMASEEIRRNTGFRLVFSYIIKVLLIPYKWLTNARYSVAGTTSLNIQLTACICPIHKS